MKIIIRAEIGFFEAFDKLKKRGKMANLLYIACEMVMFLLKASFHKNLKFFAKILLN